MSQPAPAAGSPAAGSPAAGSPAAGSPAAGFLRDAGYAALSGALLALAQPLAVPGVEGEWAQGGALDPLALVALVPVLVLLGRAEPRRAFLLGLTAGTVHFALALYWLVWDIATFSPVPWVLAVLIELVLASFLGLFWGAALWGAAFAGKWLSREPLLLAPVFFVAAEFLRNFAVTGFPWASPGVTQVRSLWLAQLASLGGVHLVTFAVVFVNATLARVFFGLQSGRGLPRLQLGACLGLLALAAVWAAVRLLGDPAGGGPRILAAVVQGNLDERLPLRGPNDQRFAFERQWAESRRAVAEGARLVVWPEGSLPASLPLAPESFAGLSGEPLGATLILGAIARGGNRQYNSAFHADEALAVRGRYDKHHLVPFGEYIPWSAVLPWEWFVPPGVTFFTPGPGPVPLASVHGPLGVMICYEAIFPEVSRGLTAAGARLLVNITNDAWFGPTSAPYQHLAMSRLRSIEVGRFQVRAANTGVSAAIDSRGREQSRLPLGLAAASPTRLSLAPAAHLTAEVALLDETTPYVFLGDVFAFAAGLLAIGLTGFAVRSKRSSERGRKPEEPHCPRESPRH